MIIRELILHNFGVYSSTNRFVFQGKKPIVLIGGMNGRGKTTFLEAVLLGLYGSNSFAYKESHYKSYGQYLKAYVNEADGTLVTYIDLVFSLDTEGKEIYKVHREWTGGHKRTSESIIVEKDGKYSKFLTDNWTMFIENILPSGLSNFFFFDGEKIAELAVEETSAQMKESIKALLGITVLDTLRSDLNRINGRTAKNRVTDDETRQIELIKRQKEEADKELALIDKELDELNSIKYSKEQKLEELRNEYSAKGGEIVSKRQDLFQKRAALSAKIDSIKEQLIIDSASELPLMLVKDLLHKLKEKAETIQDIQMEEIALKKILAFSQKYKIEHAQDSSSIDLFIEYILSNTKEIEYVGKLELSDTSLRKLQVLLESQLHETGSAIKERQRTLQVLRIEVDRLDNYLSVDIDEKEIASIFKEIKELEQDIIEIEVKISRKGEERRTCNGRVLALTSDFSKKVEAYLKKVELNDDSDRIMKYSQIARSIIDEYQVRLQKNKITIVADTMTACYKKLANKKNLIDKIEMDPTTLDLIYYNSNGEAVNKASLSAGEKQLMVISLLWALALCSKKKLPVIIDTPLSRLDSSHRKALIKVYFPKASDQTIILSTDSEIDRTYYSMMSEEIGDEYTLIYDDNTKATTIKPGYFLEVQDDTKADSFV